ncbi:hypothetical protein [Actinomadura geliboluensis]
MSGRERAAWTEERAQRGTSEHATKEGGAVFSRARANGVSHEH